MKKAALLVVSTLLAALLLAGCGSTPLPQGMDADTITATAQQVLELAHAGEYDALSQLIGDGTTSPDEWQQGLDPVFERTGAFESYGEVKTMGETSEGTEYGIVLYTVEYENGKVIWRIPFNTSSQPLGMFVAG